MALKAVCTGSHLKVAYAMTKDPVLLAGPSLRGASAVWASGGRHHPLEQGCIPQASSRLGGLAWGHYDRDGNALKSAIATINSMATVSASVLLPGGQ
jgi:hypothetical protein